MSSPTGRNTVAGIGVGAYAALVGWTAWRASERAEASVRWLILLAAVGVAAVFGGLIVAALADRFRRKHAAAELSGRVQRCQGVSAMLVGPLTAILLLSGLYAVFRFEEFAAVAAAAPLLLLGAAGLAAYVGCPSRRTLNGK